MTGYGRSVKYETSQFQFLTQFSSVLMQFVYHIRKAIDMVGLIRHLLGPRIGAVIIPSEVDDFYCNIYSDLAPNYTGTHCGVLLLLLESEISQ